MKSTLASATSVIALLASSVGGAHADTISVSSKLNFRSVLVGQSSSSLNDTATLSKGGIGDTLTWGTATGDFSGGGQTGTITKGGSVSVGSVFVFSPTATGAATSTITVSGTNATSKTVTLSGTGVAPVESLSSTMADLGYVLVGNSAATTFTVTNTGNGNLSGKGAISNLNGSFDAAGNSVFTGTGTADFSLQDSSTKRATTSQSYTYTFRPTTAGVSGQSVTTTTAGVNFSNGTGANGANQSGTATLTLAGTAVAPVQAVTTANAGPVRIGTTGAATITISNVGHGDLANGGSSANSAYNLTGTLGYATTGAGLAATGTPPSSVNLGDAASSTVTYTYTPLSRGTASSTATISFADGKSDGSNAAQTVTATITAQGVSPTFTSVFNGVTDTPTAVAKGATATTGPTISMTVGRNSTATYLLTLENTSTDPGAASLTDLTIESFAFSGADAGSFSSSFTNGSVIHEGNSIVIPITVVGGNTVGPLSSTLTLFTDESAALGGIGDTFTYRLAAAVPEPENLAVFGLGLAGLAGLRRRRKC